MITLFSVNTSPGKLLRTAVEKNIETSYIVGMVYEHPSAEEKRERKEVRYRKRYEQNGQ